MTHIVECPMDKHITSAMKEDICSLGIQRLGVEGGRLSLLLFRSLEKLCSICPFPEGTLDFLSGEKEPTPGSIHFINPSFTGRDHRSKIEEVLTKGQLLFTAQLDSLCWILNLRGFQLPYQGVVKAKALISRERVTLFIPQDSDVAHDVSKSFHIVRCSDAEYEVHLTRELEATAGAGKELLLDPRHTSALDALLAEKNFRGAVTEREGILIDFQSIKNSVEVASFESSFDKADQAIFHTLSWLKQHAPTGQVSELDYKNKTEENYRLQGAKSQSFATIAGFAETQP